MKTAKQIIDETVDYILTKGRGIKADGNCVYVDPETKLHCAVGRCIDYSLLSDSYRGNQNGEEYINSFGNATDILTANSGKGFLKEEYKGHSVQFWLDLQEFHDRNSFWEGDSIDPKYPTGLSAQGRSKLKRLKKEWC